jgi:hypothetical protein
MAKKKGNTLNIVPNVKLSKQQSFVSNNNMTTSTCLD